jgi:hypothetical protein
MKKFFVMMEVHVDEAKYKEVESWGVTPTDYVKTLLTDHARDRGLVIRPMVIETESRLYDYLDDVIDKKIREDAIAELEEEILIGKACINGNCED